MAARTKMSALLFIAMSLAYLEILLYFEFFTIPYLSPVAVVIGDAISPFTPLANPALLYGNLTQWLHPGARAYRQTLKGRQYIALIFPMCIASFMLVLTVLLKSASFVETVYGVKFEEGMCVGPCWKRWTELGLMAMVVFAVAIGWKLDGGRLSRLLDRQIEKLQQEKVEKAEKAERESITAGCAFEKV